MGITGTHRYIHTHTNIHLYSHTDWPHLKLMTRNPEHVGNESEQSCHISLVQLFSQSRWLFHTSVLIYHLLQPKRELLTHWENWNSSMRIFTNSIYKYPISPTNVHPPSYFHKCTIPSFKISPSTFARNLLPDQWYIFSNLFVILYHPSLCYMIILISIQTCYDVLHLTKHLPAVVVKVPEQDGGSKMWHMKQPPGLLHHFSLQFRNNIFRLQTLKRYLVKILICPQTWSKKRFSLLSPSHKKENWADCKITILWCKIGVPQCVWQDLSRRIPRDLWSFTLTLHFGEDLKNHLLCWAVSSYLSLEMKKDMKPQPSRRPWKTQ